ncbi:MAG: 50S ribosomal protein L4 [Candidatus Pacebacteria bacterium]|jgi:large subunit ribosomal protein L4|nr:50S ribosomal protein L4 [bacterium]MDP6527312.1 50S ribosomal protein L4 [Candidatus Paceibacterota bacterium]MDP6659410.1 50S ribosomal protein L4 [Candidatus Paceibacterota bacterium]|tara:strand:- start:20366 stop:21103 length:738 start_codon:yes stop_codon:yes gene_type:complete
MAEETKTKKENTKSPVRKTGRLSDGMEAKIYNQEGKETGKIKLPEAVFSAPFNADLIHQVVVSMEANARTPVAHTKDRGEVSGGGRKPWRQKGTGRARHGSSRSPIWRGGGITFGPRKEKDYSKKINKRMRTKALYSALSRKVKDGEVLFVDEFVFSEPKTAVAHGALTSLSKVKGFETLLSKKNNSALIALGDKNKMAEKSFSNFGNVEVDEVKNLNPVKILKYKYLVISKPKESVESLENRNK